MYELVQLYYVARRLVFIHTFTRQRRLATVAPGNNDLARTSNDHFTSTIHPSIRISNLATNLWQLRQLDLLAGELILSTAVLIVMDS
jgi:hypothetical protein